MRPLSALLAAAVLLASACGEDDRSAGASRGNSVDRAFIAGMVPHHEMGVEMARMAAADASSQAIVALARDMVRVQSREIDDMRWLDGELERDGVRRGDLACLTTRWAWATTWTRSGVLAASTASGSRRWSLTTRARCAWCGPSCARAPTSA